VRRNTRKYGQSAFGRATRSKKKNNDSKREGEKWGIYPERGEGGRMEPSKSGAIGTPSSRAQQALLSKWQRQMLQTAKLARNGPKKKQKPSRSTTVEKEKRHGDGSFKSSSIYQLSKTAKRDKRYSTW